MKHDIALSALALFALTATAQQAKPVPPVKPEKNSIAYTADARGNRVLDFSQCGYRQSDVNIPDVGVKVIVSHKDGDQSSRIQKAIDYVASLKPDKVTGLRGAILLEDGEYHLDTPLRISASGIVITGQSKNGTILIKHGVDRGAVVYIEGKNDRKVSDTISITNTYVPVNSTSLTTSASTLQKGDNILIVRPSTKEWIASVGCDVFGGGLGYWGWKPGEMDILWDRTVTATSTSEISIDVPLTAALDENYGGGYILKYSWAGRIHESGIENLSIKAVATTANPADEDHAWDGIYIDNAKDCWVRNVNFLGLAGSAVNIQRGGSQITVEDCISRSPVSEIGGMRRRTFLTMGGKCLFQRCYSEDGINDFSAGYCAPGPNAFVQCDAITTPESMDKMNTALHFSGSSSSWATGLLFDNVNIENGSISFKNLGLDKWGAGWNTANSLMWQCTASRLDCFNASDDAQCYAVGCWSYCNGDGFWLSTNDHVTPRSAFETQLTERLKASNPEIDTQAITERCRTLMRSTDASSSPTVEKAAVMAAEALKSRITLDKWIDAREFAAVIPTKGIKDVDAIKDNAPTPLKIATFSLDNLMGTFHRTPWWNGRTRYPYMDKADYAVTRFVPGMEMRGGTDRIDSIIANIHRQHVTVWNQNYGLWYDRRRDDHERINRIDGDVWAPFFEQIFARSGEGKAWDGLSKYDLKRLNPWYIDRVNKLAERVPEMLIINQAYFQHNILEAGAHWVDCPWRNVNNIQSAKNMKGGNHFLEPVPFTGDKRIFTADLFYDVTDKDYAELHRQYIWKTLDAFADKPNVYHSISEEYTGPEEFTRFWLDCIREWNSNHGRHANVILNATYDVTKAIMSDTKYADLVDIIEIEQWFTDNGKEYKPEGGKNLAPRQHLRLTKTGHPTFDDVYRTIKEMSLIVPAKPILYYAKEYDRNPWAIVFAGGIGATLKITNTELLNALKKMKPNFATSSEEHIYEMRGDGGTLLYATTDTQHILPKGKAYIVDKTNGSTKPYKGTTLPSDTIIWIR